MMVDSRQNLVEAAGDLMQILQGQLALIQLPVDKDVVDDLLHHHLNSCRSRNDQGQASMISAASRVWGLGPG